MRNVPGHKPQARSGMTVFFSLPAPAAATDESAQAEVEQEVRAAVTAAIATLPDVAVLRELTRQVKQCEAVLADAGKRFVAADDRIRQLHDHDADVCADLLGETKKATAARAAADAEREQASDILTHLRARIDKARQTITRAIINAAETKRVEIHNAAASTLRDAKAELEERARAAILRDYERRIAPLMSRVEQSACEDSVAPSRDPFFMGLVRQLMSNLDE